MSNLIKGGVPRQNNVMKGGYVTVAPQGKVTINGNVFVEKRLEELRARMHQSPTAVQEGFSEGLDPLMVERLIEDPDDENGLIKAGGAATKEEIDNMIAWAKTEAEQIIEQAQKEAEQIRAAAREDGHQEGYQEGMRQAEAECSAVYEKKKQECEQRTAAVEAEYQRKAEELEPMLVEKLSDIFAHVTGARLENDKRTVLYLLNRALGGVDSSKHYIVHVSGADYDNVREHKKDVAKGTGILPENFEIVEDSSLESGGCMIESDSGIWDCSLGTQLKLLVQQLKILSYE